MSDRGGVRSSARLSGDGSSAAAAPAPRAAQGRGRPVSTTAAAALRRARAAERAAEVEDSPRVLRDKCRRLARALRNAKHLVVYTGAGISTAADIPDYRGPHGVWTRLQRGETVGRIEVSRAQPTFTHMALTALWARGALKFVVSQNCDGLHLRAGLPRRALAELHGDMFAELCAPCRRVYLRAFDTTERTARHQHGTRRLCHACGAELRDSIVHFGERGRAAWPLNWAGALRHAARADVVLCLGSSLKVLRRYPRLWRMQSAPRARPALYIVNLQWTPKDSVAALKINARCDAVMRQVARRLRLRVPRYRASRDPVLAHAEPLAPAEAHTSRRPALLVPPDEPLADDWEPSSPSASDSDEELPLRHLADRLRGPNDTDQPRSPARSYNLLPSIQSDTISRPSESDALPHQAEFMRGSHFHNSTNLNKLHSQGWSDRFLSPIQSENIFSSTQSHQLLSSTSLSDRLCSPVQSERLHNPDQCDRLCSPVQSDRLHNPVQFGRLCRPLQSDRLCSPVQSERLHNPDQYDRLCSPVQSDRLCSPVRSDRLCSPVQSDRLCSPVQSDRFCSPVQSDRLCSPVQSDRFCSPVQSDRLCSPVQSDRLCSPVQSDRLCSPVQSDRFCSPVQSDRLCSPVQSDRLCSPVQSDRLCSPVQSDRLCSPVQSDRLCSPVQSDRLCSPVQSDRLCSPVQSDRLCSPIKCNKLCSPQRPDRLCLLNKTEELSDQNRSDRLYSPNKSEQIQSPSPTARRRSLSPNGVQNNSSPNRWRSMNSSDRQQGLVECDRPNGRLHSFQVSMQSGEATILLHAEHAPPRPLPPRSRSPRCRTADLRRVRMARRAPAADREPAAAALGERLRRLLEYEPRIDACDNAKLAPEELQPKLEDGSITPKCEPKTEIKAEPKDEPKEEASTSDESGAGALAAGSLAAAIIRRAVLLCRASLYPGLHTIIAPAAGPAAAAAAPAECAWCARHYAARRCLWYGPAREPAAAARAWRRLRGRRYLCACCGAGPAREPARVPDDKPDDGGWYGKGYRKGRRRRR